MADTGYPRSWIFHNDKAPADADGSLVGRWNGQLEKADTKFGPKLVAGFTVEETQEDVSVWLFNAALQSQFKQTKPEEGELIEIQYLGKRTSKNGNDYQNFKILTPEREVEKFGWDALGSDEDEEEL